MKLILLSTALLAGLWSGHAFGQGIDPIDNYLSSAEQKANNVVDNAGAQGRGIAMEAGQALLDAIGAFRAVYSDALNETESALTRQQEDMLQKIRSTVELLDGPLSNSTSKLQQTSDTLAAAVSELPFSKSIPRVIRVGPSYMVEDLGNPLELVVQGMDLANGEPELRMDGKIIEPSTTSDTELRFSLPSESVANDEPLLVSGTLRVFGTKSTFAGLGHPLVSHDYRIRVAVYPRQIGSFTITPRRLITKTETTPINPTPPPKDQRPNCKSPHGQGSNSIPVRLVPRDGYTLKDIRFIPTYSNHGSYTVNTESPHGYTATLSCSGWGLKKFAGVVIDAGQQGREEGYFTGEEIRVVSVLMDGSPERGVLSWGDSLVLPNLPADTQTIMFELKPFTHQRLDLVGSGKDQFASVEFNVSSKIVTVTARSIEQALHQ